MSGFAKANSKTAQGFTELEASSLAVGLPEGLMGNSEVGHLNIGAGRVVWQDRHLTQPEERRVEQGGEHCQCLHSRQGGQWSFAPVWSGF